jgi:hypothetical protein
MLHLDQIIAYWAMKTKYKAVVMISKEAETLSLEMIIQ